MDNLLNFHFYEQSNNLLIIFSLYLILLLILVKNAL
jgi:hypothetical protein